ncbi:hypothetical protein [Rhodococcus sp. USK13]|uniref:hypothetical protein n=1 Tax=Rhodococcus sp. USK13 TaxID=2806442 RepID=UPI001BD0B527|nr:hypothetical protein [Rhodococcus sp. USK13]
MGWHPLVIDTVSSQWSEHIESSRVLDLKSEGQRFLWPIIETPTGPEPVPGIDAFLPVARTHPQAKARPPEFVIEVLLRVLEDPDTPSSDRGPKTLGNDGIVGLPSYLQEDVREAVYVPAYRAHEFGFITEPERDRLLAEAEAFNASRMQQVIDLLHSHAKPEVYALGDRLHGARSDPSWFSSILRQAKKFLDENDVTIRFSFVPAAYPWEVTSLADVIAAGDTSAEALSWLTGYQITTTSRRLERAMELTARQAFNTAHPLAHR